MASTVIAIDGPAASGKSSVATRVAKELGAVYVSTGEMFRAVAWAALRDSLDPLRVTRAELDALLGRLALDYQFAASGAAVLMVDGHETGEELRSQVVADAASVLAKQPVVREWLLGKQRRMAKDGWLVMEGRDIGTVVFPDAAHKFFLTASPEVRALRRLRQDGGTPSAAAVAQVAKEIAERDERDAKRELAPLVQAEDATLVDSGDMTLEQVVEHIVNLIRGGAHGCQA